jgi:predicted ABC-type ATPase
VIEAKTGIPSIEVARILDAIRTEMIAQRAGFITETVFSDPVGTKLDLLRAAVAAGYDVVVIYIGVSPELSARRVDQRVAAGGHDVPRDRIAKRLARSLDNLRAAIAFVPTVKVYDNTSADAPFRLIATFARGKRTFLATEIPSWARKALRATRAR